MFFFTHEKPNVTIIIVLYMYVYVYTMEPLDHTKQRGAQSTPDNVTTLSSCRMPRVRKLGLISNAEFSPSKDFPEP